MKNSENAIQIFHPIWKMKLKKKDWYFTSSS